MDEQDEEFEAAFADAASIGGSRGARRDPRETYIDLIAVAVGMFLASVVAVAFDVFGLFNKIFTLIDHARGL